MNGTLDDKDCPFSPAMQTFVDVLIYAGKNKVATVCLLNLLRSPLLRKIFDSFNICDVCNGGKLSIIFPNEDEDESTLRDVFNWFSLVIRLYRR